MLDIRIRDRKDSTSIRHTNMARSRSRQRQTSSFASIGALVLLASQASALSLANFQIITSSATPLACLLAYNSQIPACTPADFSRAARGVCSVACVQGLLQTTGAVGQACAGVRAAPNSLLFQAVRGGLIDTLCPNFARAGAARPLAGAAPVAPPAQGVRPDQNTGSGVAVVPNPAGSVAPVAVPVAMPAPNPAAVAAPPPPPPAVVASPLPVGPAAGGGAGFVAANPPTPAGVPAAAETLDVVPLAPPAAAPQPGPAVGAGSQRGGGGAIGAQPSSQADQGGGSPFDFAVAAGADGLTAGWLKAVVVAAGVGLVLVR